MSRPEDFFPSAKDIPPAVQWREGMLLAPQHFQQQALRQEALLHYHLSQAAPFHWGVRRLEIREELLKQKGTVEVLELEAVMPDGLTIHFRHTEGAKLELTLTDKELKALEEGPQRVHLAVLADQRSGIGPDALSSRYRGQTTTLVDHDNQDLPLEVDQVVPWLRLGFGEPRATDCWLPLLELQQRVAGAPFGKSSDYVAPQLSVPENSILGRMCAGVSELVVSKANYLRRAVQDLSARDEGEVSQREAYRRLIGHLLAGLPAYDAVRRVGVCHPFMLYTPLCGLAGQVASVGYDPAPPQFKAYQHDELYSCFGDVIDFIKRSLNEGVPERFESYYFKPRGQGFELPFLSKVWGEHKLVLGIVGPSRASTAEVKAWGEACTIATTSRVKTMRGNRELGLERKYITHCEGLMPWGRMLLFELKTSAREFQEVAPDEKLRVEFILQGVQQEPHPAQLVLFVSKQRKQANP